MCSIRSQSDLSKMQTLPNMCWIHWESLLDTDVLCKLSEIANSGYFNKIFLSSKQLCLKYSSSINLPDVHLMVVMLFMSCINAVSASGLQ